MPGLKWKKEGEELGKDTVLLPLIPRLGNFGSANHSPSFSFSVVHWIGLKRECGWNVRGACVHL